MKKTPAEVTFTQSSLRGYQLDRSRDGDGNRFRRPEILDALVLLGLLALAALLGVSALLRRPDLYRGASDVLFSDAGYNLLVVQRMLDGGRLYADIAFQYGPLPPLVHAAAAGIFGNTLGVFHALLLTVTLVNVGLAYWLVRRCTSTRTAAVVVGLGLTASLLIPGSLLGSFSNASYIPFERTLILLGAIAWSAPGQRPRDRAILLGVVIGSWQTVRFGGGVFLGIAVVIADLLALWWSAGLRGDRVRIWLRSIMVTIAAAVMVEIVLVALAFLLLPREIAVDFVWPLYVLDTYDAWVTPDLRWPRWGGWRVFIGQYLSPLVGALSGLAAVAWYLRREDSGPGGIAPVADAERIRLLIPFLFYLVGTVGFFRMAFHFFQFAWALVIPAAWLLERGGRIPRLAIPALLLPCFLLSARTQLASAPDPGQREFVTPSGEALWGSPDAVAELDEMVRLTSGMPTGAEPAARPALLVLPLGAGFHHAYSIPSLARQPWFMNGFPRPYDEPPLLESLDRTSHVVLRAPGPNMTPGDPCSWYEPFPLSPPTCRAMAERLGPPTRVGEYWIFPVR